MRSRVGKYYVISPKFNPLDLSPTAWYDFSNTSSITASSGSVSQVNDLSGNGYHLTQGTAAAQPTTGSATINSKNVLSFDGGDSLANTSVPGTSRPHTYVIVAKEDSGITVVKSLINTTAAIVNPLPLYLEGTAPNRKMKTYITAAVDGPTVTTTQANVYTLIANGASSQLNINTTITTVNITGTDRDAGFRMGATPNGTAERFIGQIAEALYFNAALSDSNRDKLVSHLMTKWGI